MLVFDAAQFDGILKKISEFNNALLSDPVNLLLSVVLFFWYFYLLFMIVCAFLLSLNLGWFSWLLIPIMLLYSYAKIRAATFNLLEKFSTLMWDLICLFCSYSLFIIFPYFGYAGQKELSTGWGRYFKIGCDCQNFKGHITLSQQ